MKFYGYADTNSWMKVMGFILALLSSTSAYAVDEINTTYFGNLAIKGYDPVAYFTENRPIEGDKKFEYKWKNATWRFSSEHNLSLFKTHPEQYEPQYGGYCAYAVAKDSTADIDPNQFTVHEGRLYLNYNKKVNIKWLADRNAFILEANRNWPKLLEK